MPLHRLATAALSLSAAMAAAAAPRQAPDPLWKEVYGTDWMDDARGLVSDGAGGLFVGGSTDGVLQSGAKNDSHRSDVYLRRFDGQGEVLWTRQLGSFSSLFVEGGDACQDVASDGAGGAYVYGGTDGDLAGANAGAYDVFVLRYRPDGLLLWGRQLGTEDYDISWAAAADDQGGLYVVGYTYGSFGPPNQGVADLFVARYDASGGLAWVQQYGTPEWDLPGAICSDGQGGFYLGSMYSVTSTGFSRPILSRYDGAGALLWQSDLWGQTEGGAIGALCLDGAGGVFVAGSTAGDLGGQNTGLSDAWLARFDASGSLSWITQFGTPGKENLGGAHADGVGGVVLAGSTTGDLAGKLGPRDAWVARHDAGGQQLWLGQYGTTSIDWGLDVVVDEQGAVSFAGFTGADFGGGKDHLIDAVVTRLAPECAASGTCVLGERYCDPAFPNSTGVPGVLDATGSPLVAHNALTLTASQLPPNQVGYFLASQAQGYVLPPNSQGALCLGGTIARFNQQAQSSGAGGTFAAALDLTDFPPPFGGVLGGETWNFTTWFRDKNPGPTNNFTDAVSVLFF